MGYIWVAPRSLKRTELGDDPSIGGSLPTWLAKVEYYEVDSKLLITPGRSDKLEEAINAASRLNKKNLGSRQRAAESRLRAAHSWASFDR
ncbi:predicted protein [Chaetomium globosum CBS 148.51]|uniref:Uncharacterized protein n=1 Tax=Chaetomium globosum (strain ATCC 6205 / CBS 148.51 / DSM 1962 / NBRC 6347 / NRRL 1970) TaxID=306901 RepID=Q2GPB3_CHAGB|nr:uncharacterized protein CHGG_10191 [Chaetomium globosum CBS 148.51]EAQ83787.1 predicted protein [Chaetomium globosum CBS 148.51]